MTSLQTPLPIIVADDQVSEREGLALLTGAVSWQERRNCRCGSAECRHPARAHSPPAGGAAAHILHE